MRVASALIAAAASQWVYTFVLSNTPSIPAKNAVVEARWFVIRRFLRAFVVASAGIAVGNVVGSVVAFVGSGGGTTATGVCAIQSVVDWANKGAYLSSKSVTKVLP